MHAPRIMYNVMKASYGGCAMRIGYVFVAALVLALVMAPFIANT
jgi:hypothetical protein